MLSVCVIASSESLPNETIYSSTIPINILDIDGDQNYDALTDGVLILRSLFGLEGPELISGAVSDNGLYQTAESIESRLEIFEPYFDVDQNGQMDALTDGLLIIRFLFGLTDESLISNVISQEAQRLSSSDIIQYLKAYSRTNIRRNNGRYFFRRILTSIQDIDSRYKTCFP